MLIHPKQYSIQFCRLLVLRLAGGWNQGMPDIVGRRWVGFNSRMFVRFITNRPVCVDMRPINLKAVYRSVLVLCIRYVIK